MADTSGAAPNPLEARERAEATPRERAEATPRERAEATPRERAEALARLLDLVSRAPHAFGLYQFLRRVQHLASERARLGEAERPSAEPIRLGQEASLAFAPTEIARLEPGLGNRPPRLLVNSFGMLGPNGPLPLHLTEYARERLRRDDPAMTRFFDVFHNRMLLLFFRAWAEGQPTVSRDRPADDRFAGYVRALEGLGLASLRGRDELPDGVKLFFAGRFASGTRNAEGLAAVVGAFFGVPAKVRSFMRDWLDLPASNRWRLGKPGAFGRLGTSTPLGARAASRQQKFRVVLGPLDRAQYQRLLPGGASLDKLTALVRGYAGDEQRWDVQLVAKEELDEPWRIGAGRLGWTAWLGRSRKTRPTSRRDDLVIDPLAIQRADSSASNQRLAG
jgi:type VI secretion system protein ImpH